MIDKLFSKQFKNLVMEMKDALKILKSHEFDKTLTNKELFEKYFDLEDILNFKAHIYFEIANADVDDETKIKQKELFSFLCESTINYEKVTYTEALKMRKIALYFTFEAAIYAYTQCSTSFPHYNTCELALFYEFAKVLQDRAYEREF